MEKSNSLESMSSPLTILVPTHGPALLKRTPVSRTACELPVTDKALLVIEGSSSMESGGQLGIGVSISVRVMAGTTVYYRRGAAPAAGALSRVMHRFVCLISQDIKELSGG